jgi:hypothetical protein
MGVDVSLFWKKTGQGIAIFVTRWIFLEIGEK